ncbi:hypothetical protein PR202_gb14879 [Eleusine coracana subsp. coracana]|uniref:Uncharacterized protein n=1 Tax=Eleusine coracana subsp. coracana TaxID=191504 RepID=A0AAV5EVQ1_ELECO|nr:hypothetical protein PR202_gb14879 [Eleusine coracana subsp. coracana]
MDEGVISSVTKARIAVVTGGNKGIGLEVCRQLAVNGVIIVLTARDETRGAAAVHKLKELGLYDVTFHQLDVTDASSISKLADFLRSSFGKLDILVNNAAIGGVELVGDPSFVEQLFKNEEVKQELNDIENLTEERLDELLETFLKDFEAGAVEERGWPTELSAYKAAKAAMNSYSRVLARRHPELRVNCVDPGFVKTDINYNSGILAPKEAGSKVVAVALLPEAGVTGALFENGKVSSFV